MILKKKLNIELRGESDEAMKNGLNNCEKSKRINENKLTRILLHKIEVYTRKIMSKSAKNCKKEG